MSTQFQRETSVTAMKMQDLISRAEKIIGYHFLNPDHLWEALQVAGSGVSVIGNRTITRGNETYAVYGESIMAAVVCRAWIAEGEPLATWDRRKKLVLSKEALSRVATQTGLAHCINKDRLNPCETSQKLAAKVVEAVVGAVCQDGGLQAAEEVMGTLGFVI